MAQGPECFVPTHMKVLLFGYTSPDSSGVGYEAAYASIALSLVPHN